jgi:hypothetical protein
MPRPLRVVLNSRICLPTSSWELFKKVERALPSIEKGNAVTSNFKFFDHLLVDEDEKHYYMEREWRVKQNVEFRLDDVARIIVPEVFGRQVRRDFPKFDGEIVFADWEH